MNIQHKYHVLVTDDATPWLSSEELDAWKPLAAVLTLLPAALDAQLERDAGLNLFEYVVLAVLSESPDRTRRMSDIAVLAQGSLSRLSHAIARLAREGLVERVACPRGGRHKNVRLSDRGLDVLVKAAPGHVREVRRLVLDHVSAGRLAETRLTMRAILANLEPDVLRALDDTSGQPDSGCDHVPGTSR